MISRGKKQVKRKTLLKIVYLKKLKSFIENNSYWGFCNFISSDNRVKKNFLLDLNSFYFLTGFFFVKVRSSYLNKLLIISDLNSNVLNSLRLLFKNAFVLMLTNNFNNIINFPFKEYNETKLVVYAWRLKNQLISSNVFLEKKFSVFMLRSQKTLLYNLRKNFLLLRLLSKNFNKT